MDKNDPLFEFGEGWSMERPNISSFYNQVISAKKGQTLWIVTSGNKWLILPFDPSNDWSEVDTLFRYAGKVSHVFKKFADETKKEQQDERKKDMFETVLDVAAPTAGYALDFVKSVSKWWFNKDE